MTDRPYEARMRRLARRSGFRLEKSRERLLHSNNRGLYMLLTANAASSNYVVLGVNYDATLDDVDTYLTSALACRAEATRRINALSLDPIFAPRCKGQS